MRLEQNQFNRFSESSYNNKIINFSKTYYLGFIYSILIEPRLNWWLNYFRTKGAINGQTGLRNSCN